MLRLSAAKSLTLRPRYSVTMTASACWRRARTSSTTATFSGLGLSIWHALGLELLLTSARTRPGAPARLVGLGFCPLSAVAGAPDFYGVMSVENFTSEVALAAERAS